MKYEPIKCKVCGTVFIPMRNTQVTCGAPDCVWKWKHRYQKKYAKSYTKPEPEIREPKPDTIVAIGYAERQMAETLKRAGKIKTEL